MTAFDPNPTSFILLPAVEQLRTAIGTVFPREHAPYGDRRQRCSDSSAENHVAFDRAHDQLLVLWMELRPLFEAVASDMERGGILPERMIVVIKEAIRTQLVGADPLLDPDPLLQLAVTWCIKAYFARIPGNLSPAMSHVDTVSPRS